MVYLRRCGVVVHHAARMPAPADGRHQVFVVFLEANLCQYEVAEACARRIPGVFDVTFSGHTRSIMHVFSSGPAARPGRVPPVRATNRLTMEVVTTSGRAAAIEWRFRGEFVEVWSRGRLCAQFDRDTLQDWLARQPRAPLSVAEVTLCVDRMVDDQDRVAISLPDVRAWTLSPVDLVSLRDRL
jgi:hypothetical protein